ncbi:MAG: His-Xaa-Ser system radical SAM maturase HxsB [Nostoc sp. DedSLP03]|uniref:His-Xaa-Ser system radical SAM maturase HxsB n=1 Tax=Nostoc sp. DedSLP03 TaxID=3075400 RepID=UPI002AD56525|nr:His-Xaa-Ser system radical SAM maturase HxsB [Nostoc sp. DedSLP03]MDZ7968906.1 His-Xaa-Ser system radical SAM maturase HxsB [Nostoc sp. DedSLP03]
MSGKFKAFEAYQQNSSYNLLPFRFITLDTHRYILTNIAGEYIVVSKNELQDFTRKQLTSQNPLYNELKSRHFLYDEESDIALELLAIKYRTKQSYLVNFTGLHIFVVTLRCDHSCPYCQVSRQSEDKTAFDMTGEMADKGIDILFQSPSHTLKVEFQGGESLLNFELIKYIVEQVETRNQAVGKDIEFVIATNLSPLTDEILDFCLEHRIFISTSLDGLEELHNKNRPKRANDSYARLISGVERVRSKLGPHSVSALMTTTRESLKYPREIVDEYLRQGFKSIFLRSISPYGFAVKTASSTGYQMKEWLDFYKEVLTYILEINRAGVYFVEEYTALILKKMLTPYPTGYVDLQSPSGIGISVIVFNYDSDVYASDESRMLAEMNDKTFRLGNLLTNSYQQIFTSDILLDTIYETMLEGMPGCTDCAFLPYCGSDPVYHHSTQGDTIGHKPTSGFCQKNMSIMKYLIKLMEDEPKVRQIFESWL